jgi:hypothetical protein
MAVLISFEKTQSLEDRAAGAVTEQSGESCPAVTAKMPRKPAPNVAELSARLFAAYTIDGGSICLAGCTLEPVPIVHVKGTSHGGAHKAAADNLPAVNVVRLSSTLTPVASSEATTDIYLSSSGAMLDASTIAELGFDDLVKIDQPPKLKKEERERLVGLAGRYGARSADEHLEIIWCRYAAGKLRFTIGQEFVELPFSDWAVRLAPPPYACPHSGRETLHLAAIDDGRIVAAEEIAACEHSGRRVLRSELVKCSETGKRVWRELTETCPATGQLILRERMVECPICGTRISPLAIEKGRCRLCADLKSIGNDDSRMVRILGSYPGLARWRKWKIAATPESYVLEASGTWRRLLIVFEVQSLQPRRLFDRNRLPSSWRAVSRERWGGELQA